MGFSLSRAQFRVYGLGGWDCVRIHPLVKTNKSTYPSHNRGRVGVVERAFDGEFPSMLGDRNCYTASVVMTIATWLSITKKQAVAVM